MSHFERFYFGTDAAGRRIFYPQRRFPARRQADGIWVSHGVVLQHEAQRTALTRLRRRLVMCDWLVTAAFLVPATLFAVPSIRGPGLEAQPTLFIMAAAYVASRWGLAWRLWHVPVTRLTRGLEAHAERMDAQAYVTARRGANTPLESAAIVAGCAALLAVLAAFVLSTLRDHGDNPKIWIPVVTLLGLPAAALSFILCGMGVLFVQRRLSGREPSRRWMLSAAALCVLLWTTAYAALSHVLPPR